MHLSPSSKRGEEIKNCDLMREVSDDELSGKFKMKLSSTPQNI